MPEERAHTLIAFGWESTPTGDARAVMGNGRKLLEELC